MKDEIMILFEKKNADFYKQVRKSFYKHAQKWEFLFTWHTP